MSFHVWFLRRASNSRFMAARQVGLLTAKVKHVGLASTEELSVTARSAFDTGYRTVLSVGILGLMIWFRERVVIRWVGRSGGAAGLRVERASLCAGFSRVRFGIGSRVGMFLDQYW